MPVALFDGENPDLAEEHFLDETARGHQTPMHIRPSFICGCGDSPAPIQENFSEGWSLLACRNHACQAKDIEKVVFWPRSQYRIPSELGVAEFRRCPALLRYLTSLNRLLPHQTVVEHEPVGPPRKFPAHEQQGLGTSTESSSTPSLPPSLPPGKPTD